MEGDGQLRASGSRNSYKLQTRSGMNGTHDRAYQKRAHFSSGMPITRAHKESSPIDRSIRRASEIPTQFQANARKFGPAELCTRSQSYGASEKQARQRIKARGARAEKTAQTAKTAGPVTPENRCVSEIRTHGRSSPLPA